MLKIEKMKNKIIFLLLLISTFSFAQNFGINATRPQKTTITKTVEENGQIKNINADDKDVKSTLKNTNEK